MKNVIKFLLIMALTITGTSCSEVNEGGFEDGRFRAEKDFKMQSVVFEKGTGYAPASSFKNKTANLWVGYPQSDWEEGTKLTKKYVDDWRKGYIEYCKSKGFEVQLTDIRAQHLK